MRPLDVVTLIAVLCCALQAQTDPLILTGKQLPTLVGESPADIVAFRHDTGSKAWQQIPVQVDERAVVSMAQIRKNTKLAASYLVYTDANTWTGADTNNKFDKDDELVFMASDAGDAAGFGIPTGVKVGSRVDLAIYDVQAKKVLGFVYLFLSAGSLKPGAGKDHVAYSFKLSSGDYKTTYKLNGNNPENSTVATANYSLHFADRWICDETKITAGSGTNTATGVDILDRHKFQFAPGVCNRTTDTFSARGGAMIANIDGPVRCIRSVVGANSGATTQRDWICYRDRMDMVTYLRVHAINGTWFFVDYSPQASGMTYFDNNNTKGVMIDGKPDTVSAGKLSWQMVTGKQGSMTLSYLVDTDIPANKLVWTSYYDDNTKPTWNQCTGDAFAYSASGPKTGGVPNTDPLRSTTYNKLTTTVVFTFEAPGMTAATAALRAARAANPIEARLVPSVVSYGKGCAGKSGTPRLELGGAAFLGSTVVVRVTGLPSPKSAGLLVAGASKTLWTGLNLKLPYDLQNAGMPGCSLLASGEYLTLMPGNLGEASLSVPVPTLASLLGLTIHGQYIGEDPGSNAANLVVSQGVTLTVGG